MILLALLDLGLVWFDWSYLAVRPLYLRHLPGVVRLYDPVKQIQPHPEIQTYLATVNQLESRLRQGKSEPNQADLQQLQQLSRDLLRSNAFAASNQANILETVKVRMQQHVATTASLTDPSAEQAFERFWTPTYFSQQGWQAELSFFRTQIQPLVAMGYYRPTGANGWVLDYGWLLHLPFILVFGIEFLVRTFKLSRSHRGVTWAEAMLWRWYDLFLLLPVWRSLQVLPIVIRSHQARLINLDPVKAQLHRGIIANFAGDMTEAVVLRIINHLQEVIRQGDFARWLLKPETRKPYLDLNNIDEVEAIATILLNLTVYRVLPKIQPEIQALLRHNIQTLLSQSAVYQGLQHMPGLGHFPAELTERIVTEFTRTAYDALVTTLEDPKLATLMSRLVQQFGDVLSTELHQRSTLKQIQVLLCEFLEEFKLNYLKQGSLEDLEQSLQRTHQLRHTVQS